MGVANFPFTLITEGTGFTGLNGILGFSRQYDTTGYTHGPLYVQYLHDAGLITNLTFAFLLADSAS